MSPEVVDRSTWAVWGDGLGVFGLQRPPEGLRRYGIELRQGRAKRVEAWGAGELVLLDGALNRCRDCAVFLSVRSIVGMAMRDFT